MRNYLIILAILTLQGCGGSGNALTDAANAFKYENDPTTTPLPTLSFKD